MAMTLLCLYPGSVVMSWSYSEPLLIVCAAACLLLLDARRWVLAGLAAAIATGTRPNGLALVAVCAVGALIAIRQRREWRALAAALAPTGSIAFFVYSRTPASPMPDAPNAMRGTRATWGLTAYSTHALHREPAACIAGATYAHTVVALVSLAIGCGAHGGPDCRCWRPCARSASRSSCSCPVRSMPATLRVHRLSAGDRGGGVVASRRAAWEGFAGTLRRSLVAFTVLYASYGAIP